MQAARECTFLWMENFPTDVAEAKAWLRRERYRRDLSTTQLAAMVKEIAHADGVLIKMRQQSISAFETGNPKRPPTWLKYVKAAFEAFDHEPSQDNIIEETDVVKLLKKVPPHRRAHALRVLATFAEDEKVSEGNK